MRLPGKELMEAILIIAGFFWCLWWMTTQLMPGPTRVLQRLSRWLVRHFIAIGWSRPARHFGAGRTAWMWGVVAAVLLTFYAASGTGPSLTVWERVLMPLSVWFLVAVGWCLLLWWSRRRFQARPLPQRRPRRR